MTDSTTHDAWDDDEDDEDDFDRNDVADAFAGYLPPERPDDAVDASDDDSVSTLLCTASNPPGTVSATALLSGRILDVEFSPEAARMTGRELAEEIRSVAALANQQARAAQHSVMATLMDRLGKDPAETRSFLERELGLPSPESVNAARAQSLAAHYAGDSEHFEGGSGDEQ